MGKYDHLIPGTTSTTTPKKAGKYDYLIVSKPETKPKTQPKPRGGILGGLQEVVKDITEVVRAPFPKQSWNPMKAVYSASDKVAETLEDTFQRYKKSYNAYKNPKASIKEKVVAQGELSMGLVNVALSPITASLQGAAELPVVGSAAEIINRFFGALGTVGGDVAEGAVETLPVSDKTKELIRPLATEVGALVAQIAAGKGGFDKARALKEKSKTLAEAIDKDMSYQVKIVSDNSTTPIPVKTPKTKHEAYAKEMGYEPYTPVEELPIIKMGPKPTSDLPTIQLDAPSRRKTKLGDITIEPIKSSLPARETMIPEPISAVPKPTMVVQRQTVKPTSVEGAKQVLNTRAQTLEKAAVEKKLTASLGELPTHERMNMADQASRAVDFIEKNPAEALKVIRGEAVPEGILPEALYTAMEIKAIKTGDIALLKELSNSPIPTTAGQAMKALDSVDPNSPVKIIRDIQGHRETKVQEKTGKKKAESIKEVVDEIRKEVQKNASKRPTWEQFMREITCK